MWLNLTSALLDDLCSYICSLFRVLTKAQDVGSVGNEVSNTQIALCCANTACHVKAALHHQQCKECEKCEKALTSEFLYIVYPLVLHGVKVFICCFISRILQQDTSSRGHLNINTPVTIRLWMPDSDGYIFLPCMQLWTLKQPEAPEVWAPRHASRQRVSPRL